MVPIMEVGISAMGAELYKAKGTTIICYIENTEYARYNIHSLSDNVAEMTMTMDGDSVEIKCKKR